MGRKTDNVSLSVSVNPYRSIYFFIHGIYNHVQWVWFIFFFFFKYSSLFFTLSETRWQGQGDWSFLQWFTPHANSSEGWTRLKPTVPGSHHGLPCETKKHLNYRVLLPECVLAGGRIESGVEGTLSRHSTVGSELLGCDICTGLPFKYRSNRTRYKNWNKWAL